MRSLFSWGSPRLRLISVIVILVMLGVVLLTFRHLPGAAKSVDQQSDVVRFAHFSDVHYHAQGQDKTWRLHKDSPVLLESALKAVSKEKNIDFLLFTGDSVDSPRPEHLNGFFQTLKRWNTLPYYMVLGNHDVGVKPGRTRGYTIDAFRRLGGEQVFPVSDRGYYSVMLRPWLRLVVLDGTTDETVSAHGYAPPVQLKWLKNELEQAEQSGQMVVVASHFPVREPFHSKSHHMVEPDAGRLRTRLEKSPNVVAYFSGHYHSARIQKHQGVYYISSAALVEYPNAYRLVSITRDGRLSLIWQPTELKALASKSKSRSPFWKTALGNPATDHSLQSASLRFRPK